MVIDIGFKAVDKIADKFGVHVGQVNNSFQFSLTIPSTSIESLLRNAIGPFGLAGFPYSIWKALISNTYQEVTLYQFKLHHLSNQTLCWILLAGNGEVLNVTTPTNKPKYRAASKCIAQVLRKSYSHSAMRLCG